MRTARLTPEVTDAHGENVAVTVQLVPTPRTEGQSVLAL